MNKIENSKAVELINSIFNGTYVPYADPIQRELNRLAVEEADEIRSNTLTRKVLIEKYKLTLSCDLDYDGVYRLNIQ